MNQQTMTIIVTLVCLVMCLGQILMIKQAHESGTSVRIRPLQIIACAVVAVMGIYSLITGHYFWG